MSFDEGAEMERGIAQVMNTMAPGAVFSYARRGVTMRVVDWDHKPLDVADADRIVDRVAGQVESFRNGTDVPWGDLRDRDVSFYRVTSVEGEFFPLTVVCKRCNAVTFRDTAGGLAQIDGSCPRDHCDGGLQQLQFVLVHDCGALSNIEPSPCQDHGWDYVHLNRGAPEDLRTWSFRCRVDGCSFESDLGGPCDGCGDYVSFPTPVEAGSVHYAQRDAFAEIPMVEVKQGDVPYGEEWSRVLMAGYLGDPDYRSEGVTPERVALNPGLSPEKIDEYIQKLGEDNRETVLDMVEDMTPGPGYGRNTVVRMNRDDITAPDDREWHTLVADQLFTFLRCTEPYAGDEDDLEDIETQPTTHSLDHYLEQDDFVEKHLEAKFYRKNLRTLGIADAWVVDNFPLLNILFGYTRDSPSAGQTDLRSFEHPYDDEAVPIYGDRSPSEAIVLRLDRQRIVEWLLTNGSLVAADAPETDDETELKCWFLENIDPREVQNPFSSIDDEITEEVYTLIHSLSHALMSTASDQCGLDSDSISELILPNVPAIVLYAKSMEHFALGGMFTLFKTRINDWVEDTKEYTEDCIYDPACQSSTGGAACHACLHVAEFTCEYYNQTLDRNVLVGSTSVDPFWNL
jgi:hypothetical protein